MARPITWRTIASPNFDNSAMGHAINAFRLSGEGFSRFGDELIDAQERSDKQATNRSILEALQTGKVNPDLTPRADSARVYDALLGKQTAESDLKTAEVSRRNTEANILETKQNTKYLEEQTSAAAFENTEEWRRLTMDEKLAQIDRWNAQTANEKEKTKLEKLRLSILKEQNDEVLKGRERAMSADEAFNARIESEIAQRLPNKRKTFYDINSRRLAEEVLGMREAGKSDQEIADHLNTNINPAVETQGAFLDDQLAAEIRAEIIGDLASKGNPGAEYGMTRPEFLANTTAGQELNSYLTSQTQANNAARERANLRAEFQSETRKAVAVGNNLSGMIMDTNAPGGFRSVNNKDEQEGNTLSDAETLDIFRKNYKENEISKEAIQKAHRALDGNGSVLRALAAYKGMSEKGLINRAESYAEQLKQAAKDQEVQSLTDPEAATVQTVLSGIYDDKQDAAFLRQQQNAPAPTKLATDNPMLVQPINKALEQIQQLYELRPDMHPRMRNYLEGYEGIFTNGRIPGGIKQFGGKRSGFTDLELEEKLDDFNQYMRQLGVQ
jgi:hypothetical protein